MWQALRPPDLMALLARRSLDPGLIWAAIALAGLLLASAVVVVIVNRWRKQDDSCGTAGLDYQSLFEQGLLSQEELERIRAGQTQARSTATGFTRQEPGGSGVSDQKSSPSSAGGPKAEESGG